MADCAALLTARDGLAGRGSLNWSASTPIDRWEGVALAGSPRIRPVIEAADSEEAAIALEQGDAVFAVADHMVNHEEERAEGCPICEAECRDNYQGAFGPVSEADITRAPPPGDAPVEHAHSDDEQRYALHSHPGGAEPHDHEWDED